MRHVICREVGRRGGDVHSTVCAVFFADSKASKKSAGQSISDVRAGDYDDFVNRHPNVVIKL